MNIPITKPCFDQREREYLEKPLASGWVVQGPLVKEFEARVAAFTGAAHAVAVNSCTSGQFLLSHILGLGPGDEVVVPAFTWISTANCVEFFGARAVFCDIDLDTFNLAPTALAAAITPRTRAIYPVHLFGLCADMAAVETVAHRHGLTVVEDCACSLGGRIGGRHSGTFGLAGVFSFHPRKSITTGEGGVIVTSDDAVAAAAASLRDHGARRSDFERHQGRDGFLLADYAALGFNLRLTDLQGALGLAQMEKLEWILRRRGELAAEYDRRLADIPGLAAPTTPTGYTHGYQAYCTLFQAEAVRAAVRDRDIAAIERIGRRRNHLMAELAAAGIATRPGTHAPPFQQWYREKYHYAPADFPAAYAAERAVLALPFFPTIGTDEVEYLFDHLKQAAAAALSA